MSNGARVVASPSSDEPLRPREDRIRERAYQIWQKEGRPLGHHERHWYQAEAEIRAGERTKSVPHPKTKNSSASSRRSR
ncbi:MAG TPA: DUF2934 domain-containing protein [Alphaproteobacteria bacterium]|jgi:hypothetical protein|nr:DUF2934 domain-containing protein [Alphaproteobacteria bacterium]